MSGADEPRRGAAAGPTAAGAGPSAAGAAPAAGGDGARQARVALLNGYSAHNLGDALLIENSVAAIGRLRPGAEIVAVASDAASFGGRLAAATVIPAAIGRPRDLARLPWALLAVATRGRLGCRRLRALASADEAFSVGGGFLQFRRTRELVTIGSVHVLQLAMCRRLGIPLTMLPQSVGPFGGRIGTALGRRALGWFDHLLVREQRSERYVKQVAPRLADRVAVAPDLAFLSPGRPLEPPASPLRAGVVVRGWWFPGHAEPEAAYARYLDAVAGLIESLQRDGAAVALVIQSNGPRPSGDDRIAARAVNERLARPVAIADLDPRASAVAAIDRYAPFDVLVATRMHAALMGLLAGTPTIAIAYEWKTAGVFAELGLDDWVVDIADVTAAALIERVAALGDYPRAAATAAIAAQRERLEAALTATRR